MDFKGILRKHIAPIVLAGTMSGSIIGTLPVVTHAEENSIVTQMDEQTDLSGLFDDKEHAEKWIMDRKQLLESDYEVTGAKIYVYEDYLKNTETILVGEVHTSKDSALSNLELLEDNDYYETDITINELTETVETIETVNINRIFDSLDELNSYKDSLTGKNNLNLNVTIIPGDWEDILEEKVCEVSKESKEELDTYVNMLKEEIKSSETSSLSYDIRVEESIKNELVPSLVTEEKFSQTFESEKEALHFIKSKNEEVKNDKDRVYEFDEIIERDKNVIDSSLIDEEFDSIEELNSYIESLNNEGYTLSDIRIISDNDLEQEKYYLTGTKIKEVTNKYYELNYVLKTQEYENEKVYVATIYRIIKTKNDMYSLTGSYDEITEEEVILYNLTGKMFRTISNDRYRAEIKYKPLDKEIETEVTEEVEVETPEIEEKSNVLLYSTVLGGAAIGAVAAKTLVKKKRKNNIKKKISS